jgi:hypothetical protein
MDTNAIAAALANPDGAMTRRAALAARRHLPKSGIYSWWFDSLRDVVPDDGVVERDGWTMLYVGISPGRASSKSNLASRLGQHLNLNAEGSTLRLTLGVVLADTLGLELRRVGSGTRLTFHCGEKRLNDWLDEHARVKVIGVDEPWLVEPHIIGDFTLPLNLDHNDHAFGTQLSAMRGEARRSARLQPPNPDCCGK